MQFANVSIKFISLIIRKQGLEITDRAKDTSKDGHQLIQLKHTESNSETKFLPEFHITYNMEALRKVSHSACYYNLLTALKGKCLNSKILN